ncbi:MAG: 7-cyano-7-deazaguanine synthase [Patescibacteria group bacterium]|nr:7-cyano-7-deazaguanine synthase [Patescibacteria group bacterium]MDE2439034.1 7-cyano-7-deazaguanine synthase [Patescibacteria group bacterium]
MKVLCMLSGGSDSAYAALMAKTMWPHADFYGLFIDYGQPEAPPERIASMAVFKRLMFNYNHWCEVKVSDLYVFHRQSVAENNVYVPLRNLVLTSIAAAKAEALEAEVLVVGNKSLQKTEGEFLTYDGNRKFYKQLESLVQSIEVTSHRILIVPTLSENRTQKLTRKDVYFGLWKNGFEYGETFSCWFARGFDECGECKNCVEKKLLWEQWRAFTT